MKFYTQQHKFYCGIDLHARTLYVCILNQAGETVLHRNMKTDPALSCVSELWAHERQTDDSNLRVFNELRL
jgi:hypothetical protein